MTVVLETHKLRKYFGEVHAVDDVDLVVKEGEVLSLIGPNGAGKTTLVNVITGYYSPDSGKILFKGKDITHFPPHRRIREGIARSFQLVNIYDNLPAIDNVRVAILSRQGKTSRMFSLLERNEEVKKEALEILDLFGLSGKEWETAKGLAQGDRKLLDVAIASALRPRLILLDEPTSGVSTKDKSFIMDTVISAVKSEKTSAVIVEHDMDIVFSYSDRIVVMREGKVLADGKPSEIKENIEVRATLLGA